MIDPAMLTPAAPTQTKPGRGVLSVTPQSAKAFSEEFGSALRNMSRKDSKTPVDRRNAAPGASAVRAGEKALATNERATLERADTPAKVRETRPVMATNKAERPQGSDAPSNDFQPEPADVRSLDEAAVDEVAEQEATPQADQAVDALKNLLTLGALAPADTGDSLVPGEVAPVSVEALSTEAVEEIADLAAAASVEEAEATPVHQDIEVNHGEALTQLETNSAVEAASPLIAEAPTSTDLGVAPQADALTTNTQPGEPTDIPVTADALGTQATAAVAQGQTAMATTPASPEAAVNEVESPDQSVTNAPTAEAADSTQTQVADTAETPTQGEPTEAADAGTTNEATLPETGDATQAEANADQGDNPLPQQNQPTQPTATKADGSTPQPLIGGVQAPSQASSITGTATPAQAQQPGQPTQTSMLTPAQQLASAMGALRRRGDGSYMTEITLNPKELGQVRLQVHVAGNTVSMQATALDPATRALLNTGLDDLSQALTDAGLESGHLDVNQGDGQPGSGTDTDQPFAGFGANGVQVIEEEDLTMATGPADYITSTSVNTLA